MYYRGVSTSELNSEKLKLKNKMNNITVSFLEREFFAEDATRTTIRGYEPAVISDSQSKERHGRVIILEEMDKARFVDTVCFQTQLPLCDSKIDLAPILESDENGNKWFQSHRIYHSETYGKDVPMSFLIKMLNLGQEWTYNPMPRDYIKRTEGPYEYSRYRPPKAILHDLPNGTFYCRILPPVKFSNEKWITNLYYNRNVRGPKKVFDSYHISDPSDDKHFQVGGVLLGTLNCGDLKDCSGDFEDDFPLNHFLEVCYPVSLRQAGQFNPLKIRVELSQ